MVLFGTKSLSIRRINDVTVLSNTYLKNAEANPYVLFLPGGERIRDFEKNPLGLQKNSCLCQEEKFIAAMCVAPLLLLDAGLLKGRRSFTAYPRKDLPLRIGPYQPALDYFIFTRCDLEAATPLCFAVA
jgi:hypothetical protein